MKEVGFALDVRCLEFHVLAGEDTVERTDLKMQSWADDLKLRVIPLKRQNEGMSGADFLGEIAEKICLLIFHLLYGRRVVIHLTDSTHTSKKYGDLGGNRDALGRI